MEVKKEMVGVNYPKLIFIILLALVTVILAFAQEFVELLDLSVEMMFLLGISGVYLFLVGAVSVYKAKKERFERAENKLLAIVGISQLMVGLGIFIFLLLGGRLEELTTNLKLIGAGISMLTMFGAIFWGVWEYRWK